MFLCWFSCLTAFLTNTNESNGLYINCFLPTFLPTCLSLPTSCPHPVYHLFTSHTRLHSCQPIYSHAHAYLWLLCYVNTPGSRSTKVFCFFLCFDFYYFLYHYNKNCFYFFMFSPLHVIVVYDLILPNWQERDSKWMKWKWKWKYTSHKDCVRTLL